MCLLFVLFFNGISLLNMFEIEKYNNYYKMKGVKRKYLFGVIRCIDFAVKRVC